MKKNTFLLPIVTMIMFPGSIYGQRLPQLQQSSPNIPHRVVSYTTFTKIIFSVPENTDMKSITNIDLVKMMADNIMETSEFVISSDNKLTITNYNHQTPRYENDYQYEVGKTITDEMQTVLYDHKEKVLYTMENPSPDMNFTINESEISEYGLYKTLFNIEIGFLTDLFLSSGFVVDYSEEESLFSAINDSIEMIIDFKNFIYNTRFFNKDTLLYSDCRYFQDTCGYIIPMSDILTSYDILPSGIRVQRSKVKTYLTYTVLNENAVPIVDISRDLIPEPTKGIHIHQFEEIEKNKSDIKIYPNPATDQITIEFLSDFNEGVNIEIINTLGVVLLSQQNIKDPQTVVDISGLAKGTYFVRCINNGTTVSSRFMKQ